METNHPWKNHSRIPVTGQSNTIKDQVLDLNMKSIAFTDKLEPTRPHHSFHGAISVYTI